MALPLLLLLLLLRLLRCRKHHELIRIHADSTLQVTRIEAARWRDAIAAWRLLLLLLLLLRGKSSLQSLNDPRIDRTSDLLSLRKHGNEGGIRLTGRLLHAGGSTWSTPIAERIRLSHGVLSQDCLLLDLLRCHFRMRLSLSACSVWSHWDLPGRRGRCT